MQKNIVEMRGKNLAIAFICMTMLSGCTGMVDSLSSHLRDLPEDAPKGYALYLDAQDKLKEKDYAGASVFFCSAADLGYSKANSECANYSVIETSIRAEQYARYPRPLNRTKDAHQKYIADNVKLGVCHAAKYGEPAKSLCKKMESLSDSGTIKAVHKAKNQYFNAVKKQHLKALDQRLKTLKEKDSTLNLKLEEFSVLSKINFQTDKNRRQ